MALYFRLCGFEGTFCLHLDVQKMLNRCWHVISSNSMKRDMRCSEPWLLPRFAPPHAPKSSGTCVLNSSMTIGNCVDFLVVCVLLEKRGVKDGWAVIMHFKRPRAILASPEAKDATLIAWLPSITKLFFRTPLIRWHANDARKREMPKPRHDCCLAWQTTISHTTCEQDPFNLFT